MVRKNKKGISQVVTTLLFVLIALGAVLLVWNLVRGIITQSSEDIDVTQFNLKYSLEGKNVYVNEELGSVSFVVKRDAGGGEAEIRSINVILEDSTGQSANYVPEEDVVIGELESKRIDINYKSLGLVDVVKVGVAPVLVAPDGSDKLGNVLVEYNVGEDRVGHYLSFNGVDDSIIVKDGDALDFTSEDFSINFWAKGNGAKSNMRLIRKGDYSIAGYEVLYDASPAGGDLIRFRTYHSGVATEESRTAVFNKNEWHQISVVKEGSGVGAVKTYVDGVDKTSVVGTHTNMDSASAYDFIVGEYTSYDYNGAVDDVRVYDKALSADEVANLYEGGLGDLGGSVASGNLVGWWKFDEGNGNTAKDSSGNGNNGVISGATYSN